MPSPDGAEPADRLTFDLRGYEVTYLHIDYRFAFDCLKPPDKGHLQVIVEAPFTISSGGQTRRFDPESAATLGDALLILHRSLQSLTTYRNGLLIVAFADGSQLTVEPQGPYTSWEATGTGELSDIRFLCDGGSPLW